MIDLPRQTSQATLRAWMLLPWMLLAAALCAGEAQAEARVALVIGNSAYQSAPALPNPVNDAADISASLTRLGFSVRRVTDGRFDDMRLALRDFAKAAWGSELAVVYFAGHGIEIGGENWLLPVDAQLQTDTSVEQEAIALRSIFPIVGGASKLGLVVLDACRNNPFNNRMQRSIPTRAVDRGFARVEPAGSVLVAYAAKDGTTASDGNGRNSPFTSALLANLEKPGLEVGFLFRTVREVVLKATDQKQEPVVYGSLPSVEIYFKLPDAGASTPAPSVVTPDVAKKPWIDAKLTGPDEISLTTRSPLQGAKVANISPTIVDQLHLDANSEGVVVTDLVANATAANVGFQKGDIILEVNNQKIARTGDLERATREVSRLWRIKLVRGGQQISVALGG
jgi:hypothetical protein